jgi:hypothetical protein
MRLKGGSLRGYPFLHSFRKLAETGINRRVGAICSSCVAGCLTIGMELDNSWTCREEG